MDNKFEVVYSELKKMASRSRKYWKGDETLNTTALVHEAFIKLSGASQQFSNRTHFLKVAGKAMRQVLYNYSEGKLAQKRGGNSEKVAIDQADILPINEENANHYVKLEHAIKNLETQDDVFGKIVECRFFGGMTIEETAEALELSPATVKRKWNFAKSWLYVELKK